MLAERNAWMIDVESRDHLSWPQSNNRQPVASANKDKGALMAQPT